MITIQIDGKTYKPDPDLTWIEKEARSWIQTGEILEEIKENKVIERINNK